MTVLHRVRSFLKKTLNNVFDTRTEVLNSFIVGREIIMRTNIDVVHVFGEPWHSPMFHLGANPVLIVASEKVICVDSGWDSVLSIGRGQEGELVQNVNRFIIRTCRTTGFSGRCRRPTQRIRLLRHAESANIEEEGMTSGSAPSTQQSVLDSMFVARGGNLALAAGGL